MQEKHFISPGYLMYLVKQAKANKTRQGPTNASIPYKAVKEYLVKFIQQSKQKYIKDKKASETNMERVESKGKEIRSYKVKSKVSALGKCPGCRKPLSAPYIYFLCGHGFHKNCYEHDSTMTMDKYNKLCEDSDDNDNEKDTRMKKEELRCIVCKKAKEETFKDIIGDAKADADYLKELKEELSDSCKDKVEVFAKYLGKGVFNVDKWREFCE